MEIKKEFKILFWMVVVFLGVFFMPIDSKVFNTAIDATLDLSRWYAREHVILCLLPAFLIAGVISVFVSQGSVIKYFGARAKKWAAYTVASGSCLNHSRKTIGLNYSGILCGSDARRRKPPT